MKLPHEIKDLHHNDHVCLLYNNFEERKKSLLPFLREGLSQGEFCMYIADEQTPAEIVALLQSAGFNAARLREQVQLLTKYQSFLRYARFEPILMLEFYERSLQQAISRGYRGLRVAAEMTWALSVGCDQLIPLEALLNDYLPRWNMIALCQYNLPRFPPHILQDVLRTHPLALIEDEVCSNFYYEPAGLVLGRQDATARFQWMIARLKQLSALLAKASSSDNQEASKKL